MINIQCDKIGCKKRAIFEYELKETGDYFFVCKNCYHNGKRLGIIREVK